MDSKNPRMLNAAWILLSSLVLAGAVALAAAQGPDQAEVQKYVEQVQQQIAGKENEPAETVYKNIQIFKGFPAARVLRIMQMGFVGSVGVDCTHCHVAGEWDKDDKEPKQIARKMWDDDGGHQQAGQSHQGRRRRQLLHLPPRQLQATVEPSPELRRACAPYFGA